MSSSSSSSSSSSITVTRSRKRKSIEERIEEEKETGNEIQYEPKVEDLMECTKGEIVFEVCQIISAYAVLFKPSFKIHQNVNYSIHSVGEFNYEVNVDESEQLVHVSLNNTAISYRYYKFWLPNKSVYYNSLLIELPDGYFILVDKNFIIRMRLPFETNETVVSYHDHPKPWIQTQHYQYRLIGAISRFPASIHEPTHPYNWHVQHHNEISLPEWKVEHSFSLSTN